MNMAADAKAVGQVKLEDFPGEEPYLHKGKAWIESSQSVLASHNLLVVANGGLHPDAAKIVDTPTDMFPDIDETHPDYFKIFEARLRIQTKNESNSHERFAIQMKSWTQLYSACAISTIAHAPVFNRELRTSCDLTVLHGEARYAGFYDGPRAWRMCKFKAVPPPELRTRRDKEYYEAARNKQKQSRLTDHCPVAEYQRKALAFIVHINPYLA